MEFQVQNMNKKYIYTWNRRDLCFVSGSNCFVTRYPGLPILTAYAPHIYIDTHQLRFYKTRS